MTERPPESGSSADRPADGPRDPAAEAPNPWSRDSSPGPEQRAPEPPAPDPYPYVAPQPYPDPQPQPWSPPPSGGYGPPAAGYSQPPYAEPAPYEPPPPPYTQPGYDASEPPQYGLTPGYGVTPYPGGYGGAYPNYGTPAADHPQAIAALVTGIVALATGALCGVGGLVGIASIILGAKARREIDADPARYDGRGKATAGLVMGIIALVTLLGWAFIFVLIGGSGTT